MQTMNSYYVLLDVQLIRGISLYQNLGMDIQVCHYAESFLFTIAFAYRAAMEVQDLAQGHQAPSTSRGTEGFYWKAL